MKIAIVMPAAEQRGGAEMMLLRLLKANSLAPKIEYAIAFLENGPMVQAVKDLGYDAKIFDVGHLRQVPKYVQGVYGLSHWLRQQQSQAVLSWMEKGHFYGSPAAALAGIPAAYFLHSIPGNHWTNILAPWFPTASIVCCGESVRAIQQKRFPRRPTRRAYIAVDTDHYDASRLPSPHEAKELVGYAGVSMVVGMVARLQRWKGVHTFLKAASVVAKLHPEVSFVVVGGAHTGEPDYLAELQSQVQHDGIDKQVRFAGHQTNIPVWMQAMDVIVHASDNEPTGTVIIEGMALGKPVIAARTPGPMEFLTDKEHGLLTPPGDAAALADAINSLLNDSELRRTLSSAARIRGAEFGTARLAADVASHMGEICLASATSLNKPRSRQ